MMRYSHLRYPNAGSVSVEEAKDILDFAGEFYTEMMWERPDGVKIADSLSDATDDDTQRFLHDAMEKEYEKYSEKIKRFKKVKNALNPGGVRVNFSEGPVMIQHPAL